MVDKRLLRLDTYNHEDQKEVQKLLNQGWSIKAMAAVSGTRDYYLEREIPDEDRTIRGPGYELKNIVIQLGKIVQCDCNINLHGISTVDVHACLGRKMFTIINGEWSMMILRKEPGTEEYRWYLESEDPKEDIGTPFNEVDYVAEIPDLKRLIAQ